MLSAISLLLCVAVMVMWVRSCWVGDVVGLVDNRVARPWDHGFLSRAYMVSSAGGVLAVSVSEDEARYDESDVHVLAARLAGPEWKFRRFTGDPSRPMFEVSARGGWRHGWRGFGIGSEVYAGNGGGSELRYVVAPYWFLFACTGSFALFCVWARARVFRRGRRSGVCRRCGYDLRATPERCPECGEPAAPARVG